MNLRGYIYVILLVGVFLLSFVSESFSILSIALFAIVVMMLLDKLGKGIVLREIIALHTCFTCLVAPVLGYEVFTEQNPLVRLWVKQMPVPETVYFKFVLPATAGFILALCWPLKSNKGSDQGVFLQSILSRAKECLQQRPQVGVVLVVIGTLMFWITFFLPPELFFAFLLFYFASFAGLLYIYYTPNFKFKIPILLLFSLFTLMNAISSGMFTVVAYMGLTIFSFFFLGRKTRMWKKLLWFISGAYLLIVLQSVKPVYRQFTWKETYKESKSLLFWNLVTDKIVNPQMGNVDAFFPIYTRTNQGFNIALTMRRIPKVQDFDGGSRLFLSLVSAFVPRVLWPDKPEAGGKFNMLYYTGYRIDGWSTNVGPLGEAYASFGVQWGIVFMFILGLFIRWCYARVFQLSRKIPLLIFWIPVLFYQVTYSAETDTLQIVNSLLKSGLFIFVLYKFFPGAFGVEKRNSLAGRTYYSVQNNTF